MKYVVIFLFTLLISNNVIALELSKYEFDNINVIDLKLKDKYKEFKGFNGSKDYMNTLGLDGEIVRKEIDKMSITTLKNNTKEKKIERKLVKKLKLSGYDKEELQAWGLDPTNDTDNE